MDIMGVSGNNIEIKTGGADTIATSGYVVVEGGGLIGSSSSPTINSTSSPASANGVNPYWNNDTWGHYTYPDPNTIIWPNTGSTNISFTLTAAPEPKYSVLKLPRTQRPCRVFLNGRMVSLGKIGEDVIVAHDGEYKLIIAPKILTYGFIFDNKITIAVEYHHEVYNYTVEMDGASIKYKEDSNYLDVKLVNKYTY